MSRHLVNMSVPSGAPEPIPTLADTYHRLREHADAAASELLAARNRIVEAQAADIRDTADAIAARQKPPLAGKKEDAARAEVARLDRIAQAAVLAANDAARALAHAMAEHSDAWLAQLAQEKEEADAELVAALSTVRAAATKLAAARSAIKYVREHDKHRPGQYVQRPLTLIDRIADPNTKPTVASVLDAVARVAGSPVPETKPLFSVRP